MRVARMGASARWLHPRAAVCMSAVQHQVMHSRSLHCCRRRAVRMCAACCLMLPDMLLSLLPALWSAPCRFVMWAHATPVMLYTLSLISDFTSKQARAICWLLAGCAEPAAQSCAAAGHQHVSAAPLELPLVALPRPPPLLPLLCCSGSTRTCCSTTPLQLYETITVNVLMIVVVIPGELIPGAARVLCVHVMRLRPCSRLPRPGRHSGGMLSVVARPRQPLALGPPCLLGCRAG